MSQILRALIVGIDTYPEDIVHSLRRSKYHALKWVDLLKERVQPDQLELKVLINGSATKSNIISGLKDIASTVCRGDVCFFYYAGHGSREYAPKAFRTKEEKNTLETLVCADSRTAPGKTDLADKEIAYLIKKIHDNGPVHFASLMDCCFSGDNNKDDENAELRRATANQILSERKMNEFYGEQPFDSTATARKGISLAACSPDEEARDSVFSEELLKKIVKYNLYCATYRQIVNRVAPDVKGRGQTPDIYPFDSQLADQPFLGGMLC
ncbi:MAG: caspase family protein [Saprospiraceae bacterium]|nr:caspase family protein [Lewinella sp.]